MITDFWQLRRAEMVGALFVEAGNKLPSEASQIELSEEFHRALNAIGTQDLTCFIAYLTRVLTNRYTPKL